MFETHVPPGLELAYGAAPAARATISLGVVIDDHAAGCLLKLGSRLRRAFHAQACSEVSDCGAAFNSAVGACSASCSQTTSTS